MVSPRRFTACWEKEIKTYLAPMPFFFLTLLYIVSFGFTIASSPVLRFYSFHIRTTLRDLGFFFPCGSYISLYIISVLQKFGCQLHVG